MTITTSSQGRAGALARIEAAFSASSPQCPLLQEDYLTVLDEYENTDDAKLQKRLAARLRALRTQMTALGCRIPLPQ